MTICNKKKISREINDIIGKMREYARKNNVPIVHDETIQIILALLCLKEDPKILEIGTAIGYSALVMAASVQEATVVTIERDIKILSVAKQFLEQVPLELQTRVNLYCGDALDENFIKLIAKEGNFDIIFIDGAKAQYKNFFTSYAPLLQTDGIIITDNTNFRNLVTRSIRIKNKRLEKIAHKIADYNEWLEFHPEYATAFFSCGDGLAVTRKK